MFSIETINCFWRQRILLMLEIEELLTDFWLRVEFKLRRDTEGW